MAATADGRGYWLVAADGEIFAHGDARFYGSTGNVKLQRPIAGVTIDPATSGYWFVAVDGGVFTFHAPFYGSRGGQTGPDRFFAMGATATGQGYLLAAQHPE